MDPRLSATPPAAAHVQSWSSSTRMLEFLFQVFGEFILQVVGEALLELGLHSLKEPFRRPPKPWLASIGYVLLGAIAGGVSLLVISSHVVTSKEWRIVNLVVTPLAVGLCMVVIGTWRARRGQPVLRIDRFAYGYLFALSFALVRHGLAQ